MKTTLLFKFGRVKFGLGLLAAVAVSLSLSGCKVGKGGTAGVTNPTTTIPGGEGNNGQGVGSTTTTTIPVVNPTTSSTTTIPVSNVTTTTIAPVIPLCSPEQAFSPAGSVAIDNGAQYTNLNQVSLAFSANEASQMKISSNSSCGCGNWEPYSTSRLHELLVLNQLSYVSVQFKDYDGTVSDCASASIMHDAIPPLVTIVGDAANRYLVGDQSIFNAYIVEQGAGLNSVSCLINGVVTTCAVSPEGIAKITTPAQGLGDQTVSVTAIDKAGNSVSKEFKYTIRESYRDIAQSYEVKSQSKVDILLIIDNSGSMSYEQQSMGKRMATFMSNLEGLDYQIAVTTTDPRDSVSWGDGKFVPMVGMGTKTSSSYILDTKTPLATAQTILSNTVQRTEAGSGSEQGIYATYRAVERFLDTKTTSGPQKRFFRPDAAFTTVEITDEDESATGYKNIPLNLNSFVKKTWPSKAFAFHSIVTKPGDSACLAGEGERYGTIVAEMSRISEGIVGSVCAADYGSQLAGIANGVQKLTKTIELQCNPLGDPASSVIILLDGANYTEPYLVQNDKIVFQKLLPIGKYELKYSCAPAP